MKNEEIIKALNCCMEWSAGGNKPDCKNCPMDKTKPCKINLHLETIRLIENLNKKLENAVELPFKIGDMSYIFYEHNDGSFDLVNRKIVGFKQIEQEPKFWDKRTVVDCAIVEGETTYGELGTWYYDISFFDESWWTDPKKAKKWLEQLKGDNYD